MPASMRYITRWFVLSGLAGIVIALCIHINGLLRYGIQRTGFILWPASIVWLSDPNTVAGSINCAVVSYGAQFLLYGILGALVATGVLIVRQMQQRRKKLL
jgi:hypothetical protein